jgi:rhodanese-related sulfurtransferase
MIKEISVTDLSQWLSQAQQDSSIQPPVLLDIREPWELEVANFKKAPLADAQLKAVSMRNIPTEFNSLDPAQPTVIICHHGGRSYQVAVYLQRMGFDQVINLAGGIDAWSKQVDSSVPIY